MGGTVCCQFKGNKFLCEDCGCPRTGHIDLQPCPSCAAKDAQIAALEKERDRMNEGPWPLDEVLGKLVEAANILLNEKNYDGHGYELIEIARNRAIELRRRATEGK